MSDQLAELSLIVKKCTDKNQPGGVNLEKFFPYCRESGHFPSFCRKSFHCNTLYCTVARWVMIFVRAGQKKECFRKYGLDNCGKRYRKEQKNGDFAKDVDYVALNIETSANGEGEQIVYMNCAVARMPVYRSKLTELPKESESLLSLPRGQEKFQLKVFKAQRPRSQEMTRGTQRTEI